MDTEGQRDRRGPATYGYRPLDRVASSTDPLNRTTSFGYDDAGNRTTVTDAMGRVTTVGYGYDLAGRVTSLAYPGAGTVARGYDDAGRPASAGDWLGNTPTFSWDADSNLVGRVLPNGTTEAPRLRPGRPGVDRPPGARWAAFASFAYGRNGSGLLTSTTPARVPQSPETYTYSALDQYEPPLQPARE